MTNEYEQKVQRRWRLAQRVIATLKECNSVTKKGSLDDSTISYSIGCLSRNTLLGEDTFIVQKYFVLAMITEFHFPSPTISFEKLLIAYYKTCPMDPQHGHTGDKRFILCTLLALEWKRCIMDNPYSFFFHCLHLISDNAHGLFKIDDILSILALGEISHDQRITCQDHFLQLCARHGKRRSSSHRLGTTHLDIESLKLIFELSPILLFDFRDSIIQHFDSQDRLQDLTRKEESCMGSWIKMSNHVIQIKVIRKWRHLLSHTWEAWFLYTQEMKKIQRIQSRLSEMKCTRILQDWRLHTVSKTFAHRICLTINQTIKHRILSYWRHCVATSKNIERICFKQSKRFKHLLVASGRLNRTFWRIQMRRQLVEWRVQTRYLIRLSQALAWSYSKIQRRSVHAWKSAWYESKMRRVKSFKA